MSELVFFQEGPDIYCNIRGKKHKLIEVEGMKFVLPLAIVANADIFEKTKELLARQVALYREALSEGVPVYEAIKCLAIGNLVSFEFSTDSVGDILGIPKVDERDG